MSLIAWIAKDLDMSENEAQELYDMREELGRLVGSTRWLRSVSLRRFNQHLQAVCDPGIRSEGYLGFMRGCAQEALDLPSTLTSLHESLLASCEDYRNYLKQQEEAASGHS